MTEFARLTASWGDGSTPAGTLLPWYRDERPEDLPEWVGWELCEEIAGVLGQAKWAIYRWGQTTMGDGPFQMRIVGGDDHTTTRSTVIIP